MDRDLWLAIGSILFGIVATVIVSRYYFKRTLAVRKELTPYLQFVSTPLTGIDSNVRSELEVLYRGNKITDLCEAQFLIANTGQKAIRDIIEPLTLLIPEECILLDIQLLHVFPEGRDLKVIRPTNQPHVVFDIPLLNSGEFFVTKVLLNGIPKQRRFSFNISADELPPVLHAEFLPYDALSSEKSAKPGFSVGSFVAGLICTAIGSAIAQLIYDDWRSAPWSVIKSGSALFHFLLVNWQSFPACLVAIVFLIVGVMLIVASLTGGSFPPPKRRFQLPEELVRRTFLTHPDRSMIARLAPFGDD